MSGADLKRAKRDVRRRVLAARDALPAALREEGSERIADQVLSLIGARRASTVMAFWSFGSEPDTVPIIERLYARGTRVALPRIVAGDLEPRAFIPGVTSVTETTFGAREPDDGASPIDPAEIDVVITPGVAFDRSGRRVGYGGGFYDRFLARTRDDTARIAIGFDVQLVDEDLPNGHFDLRVHVVVTGSEIVRIERTR